MKGSASRRLGQVLAITLAALACLSGPATAACLLDQEKAGKRVPRVHMKFAIAIDAPIGGVS